MTESDKRITALEAQIQGLLDRETIRNIITVYGRALDARDWDTQRSLYIDPFHLDFSSIGGPTGTISIDEYMGVLTQFFNRLQSSQHITNTLALNITGDEANVIAMLHAQHYLPNNQGAPVQRMIGTYDLSMNRTENGWRIYSLVLKAEWSEGNSWVVTGS